MADLRTPARNLVQIAIATISGLFIATAVVFSAIALAFAGLLIGVAGALTSRSRPKTRPAVITLNASRTGRGWSVDPSDRY